MKKIGVEDIEDLNFRINYFGCCYLNGYDEEEVQPAREKIAGSML